MNIVIGYAEKHTVDELRANVLGWPLGTFIDDDALHNTRHVVAVTGDGDIVGAVSCTLVAFPNGDGAHFGDLRAVRFWGMAVDPSWQSKGIGSQLLQAVIERAHDLDAKIVWAYSSVGAVPFHKRVGFDAFNEASPGSVTGIPLQRVALNMAARTPEKV